MPIIKQNDDELKSLKRWCVYSHYDKNNIVEDYVLHAVNHFKELGIGVVFVSTNPELDQSSIEKIAKIASVVILRENIGYDFGSYKEGIQFILNECIDPQQITITNDSVFGPFSDLGPIYEKSLSFDIYGLTDSIDHYYHLQSYFLIYNQRILKSNEFSNFWDNVEMLDNDTPNFKQKIITDYEVGGSQLFMRHGFTIGAAFSLATIIEYILQNFIDEFFIVTKKPGVKIDNFNFGSNPTHQYWKSLIKLKFPYIKRELLTVNPTFTDTSDWASTILENTDYDPELIIKALYHFYGNDDFFFIQQRADLISKNISLDGTVVLEISNHLKKWQPIFTTPNERKFKFNEEYYLNVNLDVKAAFNTNMLPSGLEHFIRIGHNENRRFSLVRFTNDAPPCTNL